MSHIRMRGSWETVLYPWLICMCAMTHVHVRHDWFTCVLWLICMCAMTNLHMRCDSFVCAPWLITHNKHGFTWSMTHLCVCCDAFVLTHDSWPIHIHNATHLHLWHDSFTWGGHDTCTWWYIDVLIYMTQHIWTYDATHLPVRRITFTSVHVCRDAFVCTCAVTHLYSWLMTHSPTTRDPFIFTTQHICICDMTRLLEGDMTHSCVYCLLYLCHDSFTRGGHDTFLCLLSVPLFPSITSADGPFGHCFGSALF